MIEIYLFKDSSTGAMALSLERPLAVGRPGFHFPSRVIPKDVKKWYSQLPGLALSKIRIVWKTSRKACLLCPRARHLAGFLHLYQSDRW